CMSKFPVAGNDWRDSSAESRHVERSAERMIRTSGRACSGTGLGDMSTNVAGAAPEGKGRGSPGYFFRPTAKYAAGPKPLMKLASTHTHFGPRTLSAVRCARS